MRKKDRKKVINRIIESSGMSRDDLISLNDSQLLKLQEKLPKKKETEVQRYEYVNLYFDEYDRLIIELNEDGKTQLKELKESREEWTEIDYFAELMANVFGNSNWDYVSYIETGDMTENPFMISDNIKYNLSGDFEGIDTCYYYDLYAVRSITEDLLNNGKVVFNKHNYIGENNGCNPKRHRT